MATPTTMTPLHRTDQEFTDRQAAGEAKNKARRVFPPAVAEAVRDRIDEGLDLPALVYRGRWRELVDEVFRLPEAAS